jgi:hypothetical protein
VQLIALERSPIAIEGSRRARSVGGMRVACFCGAVFEADPPAGMCPRCDAPPAVCGPATEVGDLMAAYDHCLMGIRHLPEVAERGWR